MDMSDIVYLNSLLGDPQEARVKEEIISYAHDFLVDFPMTTEFVLSRRIGRLFVQGIANKEPWIEKLDYEVLKKIKDTILECVPETKLERQTGFIKPKEE